MLRWLALFIAFLLAVNYWMDLANVFTWNALWHAVACSFLFVYHTWQSVAKWRGSDERRSDTRES
ncbi:MAG TPA: hypothetical protein VGK19_13605 [Capsulimonadaceae bacterium]